MADLYCPTCGYGFSNKQSAEAAGKPPSYGFEEGDRCPICPGRTNLLQLTATARKSRGGMGPALAPEDVIVFREASEIPRDAVGDICDLATIGYAVLRRNGQALAARDTPGGVWSLGSMVRLAKDAVDAYFEQQDRGDEVAWLRRKVLRQRQEIRTLHRVHADKPSLVEARRRMRDAEKLVEKWRLACYRERGLVDGDGKWIQSPVQGPSCVPPPVEDGYCDPGRDLHDRLCPRGQWVAASKGTDEVTT